MDLQGMHIGQKIKKLRELKNLTQTHMAEELGLTQSAYSKLEMGETEVPFSRLEKIAGVFGMKPEDVIAFNESMVFNVMHNNNGSNGFVINNNNITESERKLYEDQITLLKDEINHLKAIIEKLLK
jgi:transcriptional regulator with XRE-family HTH domain